MTNTARANRPTLLPPNLPQSWGRVRLRWVSRIFAGGTPSRDKPEFWFDGSIPWLNSGAVNQWVVVEPSEFITEEALSSSSARWIPSGSVVIALAGQGKTKGMAARLEIATTCNQSMAAVVPSECLDYRFLHYWLTSNYESIRNLGGGDLRDGLNLQMIGDIDIPLPPIEEQRRIADFLDDQVGRIDQTIDLRKVQGELLESRLARTLEDSFGSGTPVPLWSLLRESPCYGVLVPTFVDVGVPMIRISDLDHLSSPGYEIAHIPESQSAEYQRTVVESGDLLVSCVGSMGKAAIVPSTWQGANVNRAIARLKAVNQDVARLLKLWVGSTNFLDQALKATGSGAAQPTLNMGDLKKFMVSMPKSIDEAERLFSASAALGESTLVLSASIRGLEERKRSLITAAVTGQLDVTAARPLTGPWASATHAAGLEPVPEPVGMAL